MQIFNSRGLVHILLSKWIKEIKIKSHVKGMPYLDGKQLSKKIRKIILDVKVVYMSGHSTEIVFKDGILEKSDLYLQKPFFPQELAGIVRKALDKRQV